MKLLALFLLLSRLTNTLQSSHIILLSVFFLPFLDGRKQCFFIMGVFCTLTFFCFFLLFLFSSPFSFLLYLLAKAFLAVCFCIRTEHFILFLFFSISTTTPIYSLRVNVTFVSQIDEELMIPLFLFRKFSPFYISDRYGKSSVYTYS